MKIWMYFLIIVIYLIIDYIFAREFQSIVIEKGYGFIDSRKYFWYTFLFGIAGMLLVIALPNRKRERPQRFLAEDDELPDI